MHVKVESPFPVECLPRVWAWSRPFSHLVSDDFGPQTLEDFVSQAEESFRQGRSWAIYADGELGGLITFQRMSPWLGTAHMLLKPAFHRKGIPVPAARTVVGDIFEHEGIGKLVFYPFAGNLAIGGLLIHLGARREGTLRAQTLINGKPIDMLIYGLSKEDFENAMASSSGSGSRDRGPGIVPVGKAKDNHADTNHHADVLAGTAGADVPTPELLDVVDREPPG